LQDLSIVNHVMMWVSKV